MSRIVRRVRQAGVYFVTSHTWQRRALFRKAGPAQMLLEQLLDCRGRGFYKLHAFVIMPDHFHALLTPSGETTLEKAVMMIKGGSAHRIKGTLHYAWPVWQPGYHDRWMRDAAEYRLRLRYIAENPVAAGLVARAEDYSLSSASGRLKLDMAEFDKRPSGAEAPPERRADVAPEGATHKAEKRD
jgi:REP-associated tyrosine transposase